MSETLGTQVTTHVLDLVTGFPAPQVNVRLADMQGVELCTASTNSDGRIEHLLASSPSTEQCERTAQEVELLLEGPLYS